MIKTIFQPLSSPSQLPAHLKKLVLPYLSEPEEKNHWCALLTEPGWLWQAAPRPQAVVVTNFKILVTRDLWTTNPRVLKALNYPKLETILESRLVVIRYAWLSACMLDQRSSWLKLSYDWTLRRGRNFSPLNQQKEELERTFTDTLRLKLPVEAQELVPKIFPAGWLNQVKVN